MSTISTHGILYPSRTPEGYALTRLPAPEALADYVLRYWVVRWDLGERTFVQEVLPHPTSNLAIEQRGAAVHGPSARRFVARLSGAGRVLGVKFRPGGLSAFTRTKMTELFAKAAPIAGLFGAAGDSLSGRVLEEGDDPTACGLVGAFLAELDPKRDPRAIAASELVERIQADRALTRAEQVARCAGVSLRTLQRLFEKYVGIGPKWIIRRTRVHDAAERAARGESVDWAELSLELGYHDQAHLIHDFKDQIGETPAAYAEACRRGPRPIRTAI